MALRVARCGSCRRRIIPSSDEVVAADRVQECIRWLVACWARRLVSQSAHRRRSLTHSPSSCSLYIDTCRELVQHHICTDQRICLSHVPRRRQHRQPTASSTSHIESSEVCDLLQLHHHPSMTHIYMELISGIIKLHLLDIFYLNLLDVIYCLIMLQVILALTILAVHAGSSIASSQSR